MPKLEDPELLRLLIGRLVCTAAVLPNMFRLQVMLVRGHAVQGAHKRAIVTVQGTDGRNVRDQL